MIEQQFGRKIRQYLSQDRSQDVELNQKLLDAREKALLRRRTAATSDVSLVLDTVLGWQDNRAKLVSRLVFSTLVLILGLMAIQTWRQSQLAEEIEEIDTAVLAGELPIDAYVDSGFDTWLKRSLQ